MLRRPQRKLERHRCRLCGHYVTYPWSVLCEDCRDEYREGEINERTIRVPQGTVATSR